MNKRPREIVLGYYPVSIYSNATSHAAGNISGLLPGLAGPLQTMGYDMSRAALLQRNRELMDALEGTHPLVGIYRAATQSGPLRTLPKELRDLVAFDRPYSPLSGSIVQELVDLYLESSDEPISIDYHGIQINCAPRADGSIWITVEDVDGLPLIHYPKDGWWVVSPGWTTDLIYVDIVSQFMTAVFQAFHKEVVGISINDYNKLGIREKIQGTVVRTWRKSPSSPESYGYPTEDTKVTLWHGDRSWTLGKLVERNLDLHSTDDSHHDRRELLEIYDLLESVGFGVDERLWEEGPIKITFTPIEDKE